MNKELIKLRFSQSLETYGEQACVQKKVALHLIKLIKKHAGIYHNSILEIGCGSGFLSSKMIADFRFDTYYLNDISELCVTHCLAYEIPKNSKIISLTGDAEQIDFPGNLNLIISSSTFQWFEDLNKFLNKAYTSLNNNSHLIFSTYSENNFFEIKQLTNTGIYYQDIDSMLQKQNQFEIIHSESNNEVLYFNQPCDVLKHIKQTGVNGLLQTQWTPGLMRDFTTKYSQFYIPGKGYSLTYCPQYFVLKKK